MGKINSHSITRVRGRRVWSGFAALLFALQMLGTQSGWAAAPSPTPLPSLPKPSNHVAYDTKKCEAACSEFSGVVTEGTATESQIKQFVLGACGTEPTPVQIEEDKKTAIAGQPTKTDLYKECDSATRHRFTTLGPYCLARKANNTAKTTYVAQLIPYGLGAVACWAACYYPVNVAAGTACSGAGFATLLAEVTGMGAMIISGNLTSQFKDATAASSFGTAGTAVLGVAALGGAQAIATTGMFEGGKAAGDLVAAAEGSAKIAEDLGKKALEKGADEGAKKAAKEAAEKAAADKAAADGALKKVMYCANAVIMTTVTALKGIGAGFAADGEATACASAEKLQSASYNGVYVSAAAQKTSDPTGSLNAEIKATAGGKNKSSAGADKPSASADLMGTIAQAMKSEAGAGPNTPGGMLKKLDPHTMPDRMRALGLNPNKLAAELESGKSVGDILGGMSGFSPALLAAIRSTEDAAHNGRAGWGGVAGSSYAGGGKAAPATAAKPANPFSFGAFGGAPAAPKGGELNFAAKKEKSVLSGDGDVFHEKFKGSIFDIISAKLDQNRTKIDQLDWQTPLNRALVGLPPLARMPAATTAPPAATSPVKK